MDGCKQATGSAPAPGVVFRALAENFGGTPHQSLPGTDWLGRAEAGREGASSNARGGRGPLSRGSGLRLALIRLCLVGCHAT